MPPKPTPQTYLGDGAYADFDGRAIRIYTSDGIVERNSVFLEPDAFGNLLAFSRKVWGIDKP